MKHTKTVRKKKTEMKYAHLPEPEHFNTAAAAAARICIIIPHRYRLDQLHHLLEKLKKMSATAGATADIYVIDQNNADKFNRGLLLNVGYYIALHTHTYDRYIFHDVDSYPDALLQKYYFIDPEEYKVIHYASPELGYKYTHSRFFGGVVGFDASTYEKIHGYPNTIFGWGMEDDILRERLIKQNAIIYRPPRGQYELAEHDAPLSFELSFQSPKDKWDTIREETYNRKNGVFQIPHLFITVVQSRHWRHFIEDYDVANINLESALLSNIKEFPIIPGSRSRSKKINIFYYKIDYLAEHIVKGDKHISYILNKNYVIEERKKRLARFQGTPIFYQHNTSSPYYNHIEPLLQWADIQEKIIDTFTSPRRAATVAPPYNKEIHGLCNAHFETYKKRAVPLTKTALKKTLHHIFDVYNECLYFRIRGGKLTHKYFIFNTHPPVIDWYQNIQWNVQGTGTTGAAIIKHMQKMVDDSHISYYMTLSKPRYLRANGCLLGIESIDYIRELSASYVKEIAEMLEFSTRHWEMPDSDFIINRKDFAYFTKKNTYAYTHLLRNMPIENIPDVLFPVCTQSTNASLHLDIPVPSADEWLTLKNISSLRVPDWKTRYPVGFFRGSSTGCGTTIENNTRLKMSHISYELRDTKLIDVGISKLTVRFKAFDQHAGFIDKEKYKYLVKKFTLPTEQLKYKYIFNIPGNSQAYRLPTEFYKGSVLLLMENSRTPHMWFEPLLQNGHHYIQIEDVDDYKTQKKITTQTIQWLQKNDSIAREIAQNGLEFARTYLNHTMISYYWYCVAVNINDMFFAKKTVS